MRRTVGLGGLAGLASLLLACASGEDAPATVPRRDCEQLREHLVELRLAGVTTDREQHRRALEHSLGDDFLASCQALPRAHVQCARAAADTSALAACRGL